jgi:hypothetical protein
LAGRELFAVLTRHYRGVAVLTVKLLLSPCFVVGASLAARRFGPRVGGLVGGLPVVAGPIVLIYALVHGRVFAAQAAANTLLGLISLTAFVVVYGRLAGRVSWYVCLLAGWLAFGAATVLFSAVSIPAGVALALAGAALILGAVLLPRPRIEPVCGASPPMWDLPLRAACALSLVLVLSAAAGQLGAQLSGLLAPFPVIACVLAVFTHTQRGVDELRLLLRGLITGLGAFALFFFTLAISLRGAGIATGFLLASTLAVLLQAAVLRMFGRQSGGAALAASPD